MENRNIHMKIGFAKKDITPRIGVELAGFGPFICRRSTGIRESLYARSMALEHNGAALVIVSCDLIGLNRSMVQNIRKLVSKNTGIKETAISISCSHTHSGPSTAFLHGWGECDPSYVEILPYRIAKSCIEAVRNMQEGKLAYAEVPCEGIGVNREYDRKRLSAAESLQPGWRPEKPELTDTTCHIITAQNGDNLLGFISYFSCHPVVCCEETTQIHGDFCGVGINLLERENPGAVGLFLQGAHGDVDSCVSHQPEAESLEALDIIAGKYADAVKKGILSAETVPIKKLSCISRDIEFSHKNYTLAKLHDLLEENTSIFSVNSSIDELTNETARRNTVLAIALRRMIELKEHKQTIYKPSEINAICLGPIKILGSGFEVFQSVRNEIIENTSGQPTLITSLTNDCLGYVVDKTVAARGGYAVDFAPFILGFLPYSNIQEEFINAMLDIDSS